MKTLILALAFIVSSLGAAPSNSDSPKKTYMSDKTEVSVELEVSGAEAICQTEDGYVWIGQYSGLTRYDSHEYETYRSFVEDGVEYSIINVRTLLSKGNTLYIATSDSVYVRENYTFHHLDLNVGTVKDIALDSEKDLLYVSSATEGATIFDLATGTGRKMPHAETGSINDVALDPKRDNYYFQNDLGVYDKDGNLVYLSPRILDVYSYGDTLYMGEDSGVIHRYDMENKVLLDDIVVSDQVNKMLYSPADETLFVACETKGVYCVDFSTGSPVVSLAGDLTSKSQLVDLMVDYEGNLWIASHYIGTSGVSIITKNALTDLLYDDEVWKKVDKTSSYDRNIYAVERSGDTLYIVSASRIYLYDMKEGRILEENPVMDAVDAYAAVKTQEGRDAGKENFTFSFDPRDVEVFQGKIFFAISNIGLVSYDPDTKDVEIFDLDYITTHIYKTVGDVTSSLGVANAMRCLRSFDSYLAIGYSKGLIRFDGTSFSIMHVGSNVLYINKSKDGKLIFDRSKGLFEVDDEFTEAIEIKTTEKVSGNRLKFLVDGDTIFYTVNSRLFRLVEKDGVRVSEEIAIPYVKGSLVELAKVEFTGTDNAKHTKYVIASETQIYITDSLDVDRLEDYEFYDSSNGLQMIKANTSGYYDPEGQKYYFQSSGGVYVYDFNEARGEAVPVKIGTSSVDLDGTSYFGNRIDINKDAYRVTINLSILGFRPNKGFSVYYKMDGIDNEYQQLTGNERNINYTNLPGGEYTFHAYAVDEFGQESNHISINLVKEKKLYEHPSFFIVIGILALALIVGAGFFLVRIKTKQALKKQLEYKNITLESIQAIARTIDAKDEYTNGHSTRVGYYSKKIAENLGMSADEVDNIYYIALLHDIGKIAIPDKILNKPGRLTDEEFAVMKSHTTRGAKILKDISTIPHIAEGAKSHHEKYDGTGYPEGLKGEQIPYVARIICCADCFDAMASKRVYKEPFSLETIVNEFKRCSGTQFDPEIAKVVIEMINDGKLKPYSAENMYLGDDGKTHLIGNKPTEEGNN